MITHLGVDGESVAITALKLLCKLMACCVLLSGLYIGIKVFIIEYIYSRFPRLKRRHDSTSRIWNDLPTDRAYIKGTTEKVNVSLNL